MRATLRPLGPPVSLGGVPETAVLSLDGVRLGNARWVGRLPLGTYSLRVEEPGYITRSVPLVVRADRSVATITVELARDASHPRWPRASPWRWSAGGSLAFVYARLNRDPDSTCVGCSTRPAALGGRVEALAELLHARGFGAEAGLGYLLARQSSSETRVQPNAVANVTYELEQQLAFGGGYMRVSAFALLAPSAKLQLRPAVGLGIGRVAYEATSEGSALTTGAAEPAFGAGFEPIWEVLPFATTSFAVEHAWGPLHASLVVAAWLFPTRGPRFPRVELSTSASCDAAHVDSVGCAPASDALTKERVHGPFLAFSPELRLRYQF
jgi:hypothetical protein